GINCHVSGNQVIVETIVHGTSARLEVVGGTAATATKLNVAAGIISPPPGSNVLDAGHTFITDPKAVAATAASSDIAIGDDGAHHLRIATTAMGAANNITLSAPAGSTVLTRLGFAAPLSAAGTGTVVTTMQVTGYDAQKNSISFGSPLPAL